MKTSSRIVLCFILLVCSLAQRVVAQIQPGFHYQLPSGTVLNYKATPSSKPVPVHTVTPLMATILQEKDTLVVRFLRFTPPFPDGGDPKKVDATTVNRTQNPYGFTIPITPRKHLEDPLNDKVIAFRTHEVGVATVPFKYRFGLKNGVSSEASADFNAGLYFGFKRGKTRFWENKEATANTFTSMWAVFVAPTVIALDAANTDGYASKAHSDFGLSVGIGYSVFIRSFSVGLVSGLDAPLTGAGNHWVYAYAPWIGFGFSYKAAIFGGD